MVTYGTPLPTRKLGRTGPEVSAIGYGAMGISYGYGARKPDEERFKLLDTLVEKGIYFIDTSDAYSDSEALLGRWFQANPGLREKIVLATKFAIVMDAGIGGISTRGDPEYVRSSIAKSLAALQTDYIDIYYYHRMDKRVPIEVTMGVLKELKEQGKIRHIGLSECSADTIRRAHAIEPLAAVQLEYSPFAIDIEDPAIGIIDTCNELGISIVAYSPLGRGFLTGRYRSVDDFEPGDFRSYIPRFNAENFPKNLVLVDQIKEIAERKGVTPAQLTLAWILARGEQFVPIPGTTRVVALEENLGALKVQLTEEEKATILQAARNCAPEGDRYPPSMQDNLFSDTAPLAGYTA